MSNSPDTNAFQVFREIAKSGMTIFEHKLSKGEVFGAALVMFNEFAMPLFQSAIIVIAGTGLFADRQRRKAQVNIKNA